MAYVFSDKLSALRRERGWSQRKVAGELGISQALLSHYENGLREPRLEFVSRICDYYGVSADYLLGRAETPDAERALKELAGVMDRMKALAQEAEGIMEEHAG